MSEPVPIVQGPDGKYRTRSSDAVFRDGVKFAEEKLAQPHGVNHRDHVAEAIRLARQRWVGGPDYEFDLALADAVLALVRPVEGITREDIRKAVQPVLWNASNYPRQAQPHILGQDTTPLTIKVVDAVVARLEATE